MWHEIVIRYILWFIFFSGLWIVFHSAITPLFSKVKRKSGVLVRRQSKSSSQFYNAVERFLDTTIGNGSSFAVYSFLFGLVLLSCMTFIALYANGRSLAESVIWMIVAPFLVVGFLYFKLHSRRIKLSHEGKELLNELLNNYRIHHLNMPEAIDQTIYSIGDKLPNSKRMLTRLAIGLREYRNENELRQTVDDVVYAIDSKWSILMANLIFIGVLKGEDVSDGLADLCKDLAELDYINEKNRQLNIEGAIMLKVIVPIVALGGLYMLFDMFDFTLKQYIEYQFLNSFGFTSFYYTSITTVFTVLLYLFFRKEKNDY